MANLPATPSAPDSARALLRHTVATLAYRGSKVLRDAPADFSGFTPGGEGRSAGAILAHIDDLLDWALSMASGESQWHSSKSQAWNEDVNRFHAALTAFDAFLASDQPLHATAEKLFQGPVADALTHVGQIAMMRRLAGAPIKGENYAVARITAGRVGPDQAAAKREF
ncbi:MAG: hypothetical protein WA700_05020 [Acidobacteriaceae bacterium]